MLVVRAEPLSDKRKPVLKRETWILSGSWEKPWMKSCNRNTLVLFVKMILNTSLSLDKIDK